MRQLFAVLLLLAAAADDASEESDAAWLPSFFSNAIELGFEQYVSLG
jgi:hypothetical protein